jgi:hypothetical protein
MLHPNRLSYTIEYETEVALDCSGLPGSLHFILDRFAADEDRFRMGLIATLDSDPADQLYIGYNATRAVACMGYAARDEANGNANLLPGEKYWAVGGNVAAARAEFHWFVPDCPFVLPREFLMPFREVCGLVLAYLETGRRPESVRWVLNGGRR